MSCDWPARFLRKLQIGCIFVTLVFVMISIMFLARNWRSDCPVRLNVFVLVAAPLLIAVQILLALFLKRLDQLSRAMLLVGWAKWFSESW